MSPRIKTIFQYLLILGVTTALVYFSLLGLDVGDHENKWEYLKNTWQSAHKGWLICMAVISALSHVLRAERWRLLLAPLGYQSRLTSSLYSLMVGYLVNLVIPRGGEFSRCYNLYKLDKVPVVESFGTVVIERIVDVACLILLIVLSFAFESQKLFAFINTLPLTTSHSSKLEALLLIIPAILVLISLGYWLLKKNRKISLAVNKLWSSLKNGMLSVFKLKNKSLFIFYSASIWLLYFVMTYAVLKAFEATSDLNFSAVLSLFAIGSIAMAAPLPGGTGSYHVLVPQGLFFLYKIPLNDAVAFTFIFHGWQTALFILFGMLSLLITSYVVKRDSTMHQKI